MSLKNNRRYRKPLIFFLIFVGMLLLIFSIFQIASRSTADKDRVTNATGIKVVVKTADNSRSAIIKTYELGKFSKLSKSKQMKIMSSTCGKVEGDAPNVSIKNKDASYMVISFSPYQANKNSRTPN